MATKVSEDRKACVEAFVSLLVTLDGETGPRPTADYLGSDTYLPQEPGWLRHGVTTKLPAALAAYWTEEDFVEPQAS